MKKLMKYFSKSLAVLLSVLTIISVIPMQAFASEYQCQVSLNTMETNEITDTSIQSEIVENRTEHSKTYLLSNGLYCDVSSAQPMHQYVNNTWQDLNEPETLTTIDEAVDNIAEQQTATVASVASTNASVGDDNRVYDNDKTLTMWEVTSNSTTRGPATIGTTSLAVIKYMGLNNYDINSDSKILINQSEVTISAEIKVKCDELQTEKMIVAKTINTDWTENELNISKIGSDVRNGVTIDYNTIDTTGNHTWNITTEYIKWENGSKNNNGIILYGPNSREVEVSEAFLVRCYRIIDDNDNGFTYHTEDIGRAGNIYINDFTNTMFLERSEFGFGGNIMPVSIKRFITPHTYTNSWVAGGIWNYESTIKRSGTAYVWKSLNGSSVKFQRDLSYESEDTKEKWLESSYASHNHILWVTKDGATDTGYSIQDSDNNIYTFNSNGILTSIASGTNNADKIEIKYNGSKIAYIIDGVGRIYFFYYYDPEKSEEDTEELVYRIALVNGDLNSNNELQKVSETNEITDEVTYPHGGNEYNITPTEYYIDYSYQTINGKGPYLTEVSYSDGKSVYYTYDSHGRLKSIKNIDNSLLEFTYAISCEQLGNYQTIYLNPVYQGRISSYSKKVLNSDGEYILDYVVNIDAQNTYRRNFIKSIYSEDSVLSSTYEDTIQFNSNLDVLYMIDNQGNEYYADYNDSHQLLSLVIPNEECGNLVSNGTMEPSFFTGLPDEWNVKTSSLPNIEGSDESYNDNCLKITNTIGNIHFATQEIIINGSAKDKYVISAFGLAQSTIPKNDRFWGVRVFADNNPEPIHSMAFDTSLYGVGQNRKTAFSLKEDTEKLTIQLVASDQLGEVIFDNIALYKSELAYVYEEDDLANDNSCICSDCEYINCTCECETESSCPCVSCDIKTTTLNDTHGNEIQNITTNGLKSLISQNEYTANSNYLSKYIDENNISTAYEYNMSNGLLTSQTFANDETIYYGYNAIGALTSVSQAVNNMNTTYAYENDKISSISHNGFSYNYEYDIYGNVKSISVEDKTLLTYSYNNDHNRSIGAITYGNGKKLSYAYDEKGNITEIYIDNENTPKYEYEYDVYNNLVTYIDHANNTITSYNKTIGEKTYEIVVQRMDDAGTIIYSIESDSDSSYVESVFGRDYSISKTVSYDSKKGTSTATTTTPVILFNKGGKATVTTTSDSLDRRIEEKLKFTTDVVNYQNASIEVKNEYTYKNVDSSQTTKLIETFKATLITTDENGVSTTEELINLKYKYDSAGRIITIYEYRLSGISGYYHPIALYEYDKAGQLIAEAHGYSNDVWGYTYDAGGNITSKNKLDYNDVIVEDVDNPRFDNLDTTKPLKTIKYGYDNKYKDLLVSFDGKTISHDNAGNPLNYHGYTIGGETSMNFSWAGRNLVEAVTQDGDSKFKYTYDASGIRTKKEIYEQESFTIATTDADGNPTTESKSGFIKTCAIEYVWSNGMIVAQKVSTYSPVEDENGYYVMADKEVAVVENDDSIIVKPLYNDFNEPLGVNCYITTEDGEQSETFYFIKDAQGNVRSIYSMENDYTINMNYDAFGNYSLGLSGDAIDEMQNSIVNANGELNQIVAGIVVGIAMTVMVCITFTAAPHSYRGYIYDIETGLYYCKSRYYSPSWGRFINADEISILEMTVGEVHGANIFAYCNNDPINNIDPSGYYFISLKNLTKIFFAIGLLNPVAYALVPVLVKVLKVRFSLFLLKLSAPFPTVIKVIILGVGLVVGLPIVAPFAQAVIDAVLQGKKGIDIGIKRLRNGTPYGFTFSPSNG